MQAERFQTNPVITTESSESIGENVNGPSIVRVDDVLDDPFGTYYMYFAHHGGEYIRLAYADDPRGPWTVHEPGTLHIEDTRFDGHIASPDAHVDANEGRIRLYFHGCCGPFDHPAGEFNQVTDVATSSDGLEFDVRGHTLGNPYFRVWEYEDTYYAVATDGNLYRSEDPLAQFERLHELVPTCRHFAVRFLDETTLQLFMTRRGDRPERMMVAAVDLDGPPETWRADPHPPETVLWPEREYEGGSLPLSDSESGSVDEPVRQLRDPAILEDGGRVYLFYAIAGERGIAGAEVTDDALAVVTPEST